MASYFRTHREVARRGRLVQAAFQRATGRPLILTSAKRSSKKQAELYQAWREGRSRIPAAPPGRSAHEHGLALDFSVGTPYPQNKRLWERYWQIARAHGFRVLGERDPVHIEAPNWREMVG